jgi:hypothetical protein
VEVEQQPDRDVHQFHVTQQLGLMDRQYVLDSLNLNKKTPFNQQNTLTLSRVSPGWCQLLPFESSVSSVSEGTLIASGPCSAALLK